MTWDEEEVSVLSRFIQITAPARCQPYLPSRRLKIGYSPTQFPITPKRSELHIADPVRVISNPPIIPQYSNHTEPSAEPSLDTPSPAPAAAAVAPAVPPVAAAAALAGLNPCCCCCASACLILFCPAWARACPGCKCLTAACVPVHAGRGKGEKRERMEREREAGQR